MNFDAYNAAHAVADRVSERMVALRQADRDVALYCGVLAFDGATAEDVYKSALDHLGVPKRDTVGLRAPELRMILKTLPRSGTGGVVTRSYAALAQDSKSPSSLDSILAGVKSPRDLSTRNDFRR
jgi:hypothetical protein